MSSSVTSIEGESGAAGFSSFLRRIPPLPIPILAVLLFTFAAFRLHLPFSTAAFIYLVIIVLSALQLGFPEATLISLVAIASLDYYFLPPLHSFRMDDPQSWTALVTFEFAGLIVSRLSTQVQHQARIAGQERNRMQSLYELATNILQLDRHADPGPQIAQSVLVTMGVGSVALLDGATGEVHTAGLATPQLEGAVRAVWDAGVGQDDPSGQHCSRVLRLGARGIGAITVEARHVNPLMMDGIASITAVAFERSRSLEKEALAEAARRSEQLRSTVLDALAHAFKTPLTAILASSSGLLDGGTLRGPQLELVRLIDNEAIHLNDLATRLLQTARLDSASMRIHDTGCTLGLLVEKVLAPFSQSLAGHPIEIELAAASGEPSEAPVPGDCELLATALRQLIDNAIKYSDPGTPIRLSANAGKDEIVVSVHNFGLPIRREDRERIFERFYRSPGTEHRAAGTGLGLSITRKIAEAHGGRVRVAGEEGSGTTFVLSVPQTAQ